MDWSLFWFEIIETYWNVNVYSILLLRSYRREIIETYWNVNIMGIGTAAIKAGK